jgi:CheY-like chemotaxis protein
LDLNLPQLTGHEVLAHVKRDATLKEIPVVVLTGSANPADIEQSYALGANAYVQKPLELDEYLATIHDLIGFWYQRAILPSAA